MVIILCSTSAEDYNDPIVPGLTHFSLSARLNEEIFRFARYTIEKQYIELFDQNHDLISRFASDQSSRNQRYSARYNCINWLLSNVNPGDHLKAVHLSDLGDNAEEAEKLYFAFLKKCVDLSFYDESLLDTQDLCLSRNPSDDQRSIISCMLKKYYLNLNGSPVLSKEDMCKLSGIPDSKKK